MPGRSNDPALRHNPPRRVTRAVARQPRPAVSALLRHCAARPAASQGALNPHQLGCCQHGTAASYSTLGGSLVSSTSPCPRSCRSGHQWSRLLGATVLTRGWCQLWRPCQCPVCPQRYTIPGHTAAATQGSINSGQHRQPSPAQPSPAQPSTTPPHAFRVSQQSSKYLLCANTRLLALDTQKSVQCSRQHNLLRNDNDSIENRKKLRRIFSGLCHHCDCSVVAFEHPKLPEY